jgi:nitrous oxidase accessory protein NosD
MSKAIALTLVLISLTALCIITVQSIKAKPRTIIIPDDYPTITAAIGNATDGDIVFMRSGTYEGPINQTLMINKTLSLIGEGAELTIINLHPQYHQVTYEDWGMNGYYVANYTSWDNSIIIYADNTTISGITISSSGDASIVGDRTQITKSNITIPEMSIQGPYSNIVENMLGTTLMANGSYSRIEENNLNALQIFGSYLIISKNTVLGPIGVRGEYCKVSTNIAIGIRDSLGVTTFGAGIISLTGSYCEISSNNVKGIDIEASSCFIHHNNVTEDKNSGRGHIAGDGNIVANNLFDHLAYGIELGGSNNSIYANRITRNGEGLAESGKSNIIYANYVANNGWGVDTGYNDITATLYHNNFVNNRFQVSTIFPVNQIDFFDSGTTGNYWSNYNGTDADGNGVGDTPYVVDATRSDRYPLMAPFDIDSVIISVPEWAYTMPTPPSLPTLPPFPSTTQPLTPPTEKPNPSLSTSPSPSASQQPASSPSPQPARFPTEFLYATAASTAAIAAIITAAVVLRRRKQ